MAGIQSSSFSSSGRPWAPALAALVAASAAWLSLATVTFERAGGARVGILPVDARHGAVALAAGALVLGAAWASRRGVRVLAAVSPLVLVGLPWLPVRVPPAFLLWSGPIVGLLWSATAVGVVAACVEDDYWVAHVRPHRWAVIAGVCSCLVFGASAWAASAEIPGGDEPHYLVITQSLLYDHDLQIENNHERGDYRAYFPRDLKPNFNRRGRNGAIYSIHAPGLPAIVLPAFAVGGYHGVVVFLVLVASIACALAWWLAWRVTGSVAAAWFGWAAVSLSAPYVLESFTVYPDGFGAAVVLTGVWALLRADWERESRTESWVPWLWHGAALASLPWLHTRLAVIAATLGGLILVRLARSPNAVAKAIAFLSVPAVSALGWLFFFVAIYGTPDPSAPYGQQTQNSFAYFPNGLGGLLFDQGFGLLATAPVLIVALVGLVRLRRFAAEWALIFAPYVLAVATFAMWWGGWSAPARFLTPLVLPLAIPAASAWVGARTRGMRAVMIGLLVVSAWLSYAMVAGDGGRLGFHPRNAAGPTEAPWAAWAAPIVDLPSALPAFVPLPFGTAVEARNAAARAGIVTALPWMVVFGALAWVIGRMPRKTSVPALAAIITGAGAIAAMVCATIAWHLSGVDPVRTDDSQIAGLRVVASGHVRIIDLTGRRWLSTDAFAASMTIEVPVEQRLRRGSRTNRPLAVLAELPAGDYDLSVRASGDEGWIMAGIAPDQFAIVMQPLAAARGGLPLHFPVDVRGIVVRADDVAADVVKAVQLHPVHLQPRKERAVPGVARRAVRYGSTDAYFMDGGAFPEPAGFWVGGAQDATVVFAPEVPPAAMSLLLRNGPVANHVLVASGMYREELALTAGEERRVSVPVDPGRRAAAVTFRTSAGFRPSERDASSRDARFLGVYVTVHGS